MLIHKWNTATGATEAVTTNDFGGPAEHQSATADTLIKTGAGVLYGIEVTTGLSAATIVIRDSLTAGAGTVMCTIPASSAIGYQKHFFGVGMKFSTGLFADFGGTGTITLLYA